MQGLKKHRSNDITNLNHELILFSFFLLKYIVDKPRQRVKKQRDYFADKGLNSQGVFPVVTYGCESWTLKKSECQKIDAFNL